LCYFATATHWCHFLITFRNDLSNVAQASIICMQENAYFYSQKKWLLFAWNYPASYLLIECYGSCLEFSKSIPTRHQSLIPGVACIHGKKIHKHTDFAHCQTCCQHSSKIHQFLLFKHFWGFLPGFGTNISTFMPFLHHLQFLWILQHCLKTNNYNWHHFLDKLPLLVRVCDHTSGTCLCRESGTVWTVTAVITGSISWWIHHIKEIEY